MTQYALLLLMIAQATGYKAGKFNHYINNLHIYDRHEQAARMIVKRELKPRPTLFIDDTIKNFYDFEPKHFKLEGYDPHPQIKLEVAI